MNRHQRRKHNAMTRNIKLPPARQDGRPQFYDIAPGEKVQCYHCVNAGLVGINHGHLGAFMADPANAPSGDHRELMTVCKGHLPKNAVIYNPGTNLCRDVDGTNTWMEDSPDSDSTAKIAAKAGITLPES